MDDPEPGILVKIKKASCDATNDAEPPFPAYQVTSLFICNKLQLIQIWWVSKPEKGKEEQRQTVLEEMNFTEQSGVEASVLHVLINKHLLIHINTAA